MRKRNKPELKSLNDLEFNYLAADVIENYDVTKELTSHVPRVIAQMDIMQYKYIPVCDESREICLALHELGANALKDQRKVTVRLCANVPSGVAEKIPFARFPKGLNWLASLSKLYHPYLEVIAIKVKREKRDQLHAKTVVFDKSRVLIRSGEGSVNNNNKVDTQHEMGVMVFSGDDDLANTVRTIAVQLEEEKKTNGEYVNEKVEPIGKPQVFDASESITELRSLSADNHETISVAEREGKLITYLNQQKLLFEKLFDIGKDKHVILNETEIKNRVDELAKVMSESRSAKNLLMMQFKKYHEKLIAHFNASVLYYTNNSVDKEGAEREKKRCELLHMVLSQLGGINIDKDLPVIIKREEQGTPASWDGNYVKQRLGQSVKEFESLLNKAFPNASTQTYKSLSSLQKYYIEEELYDAYSNIEKFYESTKSLCAFANVSQLLTESFNKLDAIMGSDSSVKCLGEIERNLYKISSNANGCSSLKNQKYKGRFFHKTGVRRFRGPGDHSSYKQHLVEKIHNCESGDTVEISMPNINDPNFLLAILNACKRGVCVKLITGKFMNHRKEWYEISKEQGTVFWQDESQKTTNEKCLSELYKRLDTKHKQYLQIRWLYNHSDDNIETACGTRKYSTGTHRKYFCVKKKDTPEESWYSMGSSPLDIQSQFSEEIDCSFSNFNSTNAYQADRMFESEFMSGMEQIFEMILSTLVKSGYKEKSRFLLRLYKSASNDGEKKLLTSRVWKSIEGIMTKKTSFRELVDVWCKQYPEPHYESGDLSQELKEGESYSDAPILLAFLSGTDFIVKKEERMQATKKKPESMQKIIQVLKDSTSDKSKKIPWETLRELIISKHKDYPLRLTSTAQFYQAVLASNSYAQCIKTLSDLNCFDFFAGDDCSPFSMVQYCHSEEGARLKEWLNDTLHVRALADKINSIEEFNWALSAIDPCTEVRDALIECLYNKHCSTAKKNTSVKAGLFSASPLTTDRCITKLCRHYESNQHAKVSTDDPSTRYRKFLDSLEEAIPDSSLRINKTT